MSEPDDPTADNPPQSQVTNEAEISPTLHKIKWSGGVCEVNVDLDEVKEVKFFVHDSVKSRYIYKPAVKNSDGKSNNTPMTADEAIRTTELLSSLKKLDVNDTKGSPQLVDRLKTEFVNFEIHIDELDNAKEMKVAEFASYREMCQVDITRTQRKETNERVSSKAIREEIKAMREGKTTTTSEIPETKTTLVLFREAVITIVLNSYVHQDKPFRDLVIAKLKTDKQPEKFLVGLIESFLSHHRFEIIRKYVVNQLDEAERVGFSSTLTGVEFMQKLKEMADEEAYAEFKKKLRPFSNSDSLTEDMEKAKTFVDKANLYLSTIVSSCKILKEFDEKYNNATLVMMQRFDRLDFLRTQGRLMIARSPNLGSTILAKLCGESDVIQFAKEHQDKSMGAKFLEDLLSCRANILAAAKSSDKDAANPGTPAVTEEKEVIGLNRVTVKLSRGMEQSEDAVHLEALVSKVNIALKIP